MKKTLQKIQAFTLIELIVVIAIIAILATSGTLMLTKWFSSARDSSRKQAVSQISTALDVSMTSRTSFPTPQDASEIYDVSGALVWYQGVFGPTISDILNEIDSAPQDPQSNEYYGYSISSDKKKYQLKAELENQDTIAYLNQAYAANDENKIAYVDGNYNGYVLTYTGGKYYLYKLPSIFMKNEGLNAGSKIGSGTMALVNPGSKISNNVQVKVVDITSLINGADDGSTAATKLGIDVNLISKVVSSAAGSADTKVSSTTSGSTGLTDGTCGTANATNTYTAPNENLCNVGNSSFTDSEGTDGTFNRDCTGSNGGADANCSANKKKDGTCGSAHGGSFQTAPSTNLCDVGNSTFTDSEGSDGNFNWTCDGVNEGNQTSCSATKTTPLDNYTKLLIHSDSTNGSTTFVDSSNFSHNITANGTAQHSSTQAKFGSTSIYNDLTSYLAVADSDDFYFDGDFTIDMWVRLNSGPHTMDTFISQRKRGVSSDQSFYLGLRNNKIIGIMGSNQFIRIDSGGPTFETDRWYHVAFVRYGSTAKLFVDGQEAGTDTSASGTPANLNFDVWIGCEINSDGSPTFCFDGYIDEVRVNKGIARRTSAFTPPSAPY